MPSGQPAGAAVLAAASRCPLRADARARASGPVPCTPSEEQSRRLAENQSSSRLVRAVEDSASALPAAAAHHSRSTLGGRHVGSGRTRAAPQQTSRRQLQRPGAGGKPRETTCLRQGLPQVLQQFLGWRHDEPWLLLLTSPQQAGKQHEGLGCCICSPIRCKCLHAVRHKPSLGQQHCSAAAAPHRNRRACHLLRWSASRASCSPASWAWPTASGEGPTPPRHNTTSLTRHLAEPHGRVEWIK